jgi:HSP20 family protein
VIERAFGRERQTPWMPATDVYETEDEVVVTVELPGIEAEDVEVSVEDSTLSISGARELSDEVEREHYHRIERRYGSFRRSIALPPQADTGKVDARFADGVLTIEVPKVEKATSRTIEIKGAQKKAER